MINEKEKALLDFLYKQANEVAGFMHRNGYDRDDFKFAGFYVNIDEPCTLLNGTRITFDSIEASFTQYKGENAVRYAKRRHNPYNGKPYNDETIFDCSEERGGINV